MKRYIVEVTRTYHKTASVAVMASSEDEAYDKVMFGVGRNGDLYNNALERAIDNASLKGDEDEATVREADERD